MGASCTSRDSTLPQQLLHPRRQLAQRRALLTLCARALSRHGVAYVSYNALPGGHLRQALREIAGLSSCSSTSTARAVRSGTLSVPDD